MASRCLHVEDHEVIIALTFGWTLQAGAIQVFQVETDPRWAKSMTEEERMVEVGAGEEGGSVMHVDNRGILPEPVPG